MQVEYECIRAGVRLRDLPSPWFTWRDLLVLVACRPPGSPLSRALAGECVHTEAEHQVMVQTHMLAVANWQRGGGRKGTAPKPPDCLLPPKEKAVTHYGNAAMSLDEAADWLGWELEIQSGP